MKRIPSLKNLKIWPSGLLKVSRCESNDGPGGRLMSIFEQLVGCCIFTQKKPCRSCPDNWPHAPSFVFKGRKSLSLICQNQHGRNSKCRSRLVNQPPTG